MVGTWQDPFRQREVWYDSGLEAKLLLVLIAAPDVIEIREQQRANFVLGGKKRHHFFDCVVRWTDNWRSSSRPMPPMSSRSGSMTGARSTKCWRSGRTSGSTTRLRRWRRLTSRGFVPLVLPLQLA